MAYTFQVDKMGTDQYNRFHLWLLVLLAITSWPQTRAAKILTIPTPHEVTSAPYFPSLEFSVRNTIMSQHSCSLLTCLKILS